MMRREQDWQKGQLGVSEFADETDRESSFGQCEGHVKEERVGVLGASPKENFALLRPKDSRK